MNKILLLIALGATTGVAINAQTHHGYYTKPEMADVTAFNENNSSAVKTLNCWATPELIMPMELADKTVQMSNIYNNNSADMIVRPSTMNGTTNKYFTKLTGTSVDGDIKDANFENGYLEVTVPSKMDYPRTDPEEPVLKDMPASGNVMDFHICLGGKPARINDAGNTLSATGDECQLNGCTGAYVGIKAPAGCTVKLFLGCSQISEKNYLADTSGIAWNPNFYGTISPAVFDFAEACDGTYKEMTSGAPYNCLAGMNYSTTSWPKGYCVKYIDVVVYGVKPGDKVGFGGVQTLHDGWTPKEFVAGWNAGVNDLSAEENQATEYYNLQGMKVNDANLAPGIYVKRQGSKSTKVVVK